MKALLALVAACGGMGNTPVADAPKPPIAYDATIFWNASEVPDVQAVRFDGTTIEPGFTFADTWPSLDAPTRHRVDAITLLGIVSFDLAPSQCGGACRIGDFDCDKVVSEQEQWIFFHGILQARPDPLEFAADEGSCTDGVDSVAWAASD